MQQQQHRAMVWLYQWSRQAVNDSCQKQKCEVLDAPQPLRVGARAIAHLARVNPPTPSQNEREGAPRCREIGDGQSTQRGKPVTHTTSLTGLENVATFTKDDGVVLSTQRLVLWRPLDFSSQRFIFLNHGSRSHGRRFSDFLGIDRPTRHQTPATVSQSASKTAQITSSSSRATQ